jgi:hypothetical protein
VIPLNRKELPIDQDQEVAEATNVTGTTGPTTGTTGQGFEVDRRTTGAGRIEEAGWHVTRRTK